MVDWITTEVQKLKVYWGYAATDVQFGPRGKVSHVGMKSLITRKAAAAKSGRATMGAPGANNESKSDEPASLACASLLFCYNKQADWDMFTAINDSGLVYDGGLVVDEVSLLLRVSFDKLRLLTLIL
jgi:hypothetical protein